MTGSASDSATLGAGGRPASNLPVLLAVLVTVLVWSSNFPTIRYILQHYDPAAMSVLRIWSGAAVLGVVALVLRVPLPALRDWPLFAAYGLTGVALATWCLNLGLQHVTAGAGAFLIGTVPVFSALLARVFLAERLPWRAWAGIGLSFCGVALIALGEGGGLESGFGLNLGALFVVGSAANQALFYVFQKPAFRRYSPLQVTCYSVWCGALWMVLLSPALPPVLARAPWTHTLAVLYLGVFPTAIAFGTWAYALSRAPAGKVTSSLFALPLLAISAAWLWLGEVPGVLTLAGGLVALAGVALVHLRRR